MSRRRSRGSRVRQRFKSCATEVGTVDGSSVQSTSFVNTCAKCVGDILADKGPPTGEHLVQHGAKRPDSSPLVDRPALRLFGCHVGGGADDHPHLCRRRGQRDGWRFGQLSGGTRRRRLECLRQTEVEHLDGPVVTDLDVGRLQIAVDNTRLMRSLERVGDLSGYRQHFLDRKRARLRLIRLRASGFRLQALYALCQGRSLDELEETRAWMPSDSSRP